MLYIKTDGSDLDFFRSLETRYEDIIVADSKNFDGSSEMVEVFVTLTPSILTALTVIITEVLSYMKSKHADNANNTTEIQIEKKTKSGEFKVIVKSTEIKDVNESVEQVIKQIKKND